MTLVTISKIPKQIQGLGCAISRQNMLNFPPPQKCTLAKDENYSNSDGCTIFIMSKPKTGRATLIKVGAYVRWLIKHRVGNSHRCRGRFVTR
jgi:hypothetical protein